MDPAWIPAAYDIQVIFDDQISKEGRQLSLSAAMQKLGEPALPAHDALHDAKNTVCVCMHLDLAKGLSACAALQKQTQRHEYSAAERDRYTRLYPTKEAAATCLQSLSAEQSQSQKQKNT